MLKKNLCFFLFLFVCPIFSEAQEITDEELRADMAFLKKRLVKQHPGLYQYISEAQYDSLYQYLYANVPPRLGIREAYRYIAPLITSIQDAHTSYRVPKKLVPKKPQTLPLYIRQFGENYYIALNGSDDSTMQRGDQLLTVDEEPIAKVIENLKTIYGTDNNNKVSKRYYSTRHFSNFYYKYYGEKDSIRLSFLHNDTLRLTKIASLTAKATTANLKKRYKNIFRKNFDYHILDSTARVAHLEITSFSLGGHPADVAQLKYKRMLKQRFRAIEADSIQHLIVDFRGNGGGFIPNIHRLLRFIMPEPFRIMDTVFIKKMALRKAAPFYTVFPPLVAAFLYKSYDDTYFYRKPRGEFRPYKQYHYDNHLYFLMDGGSYSATTFTLGIAYDKGIGTYIGEQPGGTNWGSFAITWDDFKLPNSKIRIHAPMFRMYHHLPNQRAKTLFLEPDYSVGQNFADFLQMKDSMIEFVKRLIVGER